MSEPFRNKVATWVGSFLMAVVMTLTTWNLKQTFENSMTLQVLSQKMDQSKEALADNKSDHQRIFNSIANKVQGRDFDLKVAELNTELTRIRVDIGNIGIRLSVLESKIKPQ